MTMVSLGHPAALLRRVVRDALHLLQPVGNDGLRKSERDAMAAQYLATLGATPAATPERRERVRTLMAKVQPRPRGFI